LAVIPGPDRRERKKPPLYFSGDAMKNPKLTVQQGSDHLTIYGDADDPNGLINAPLHSRYVNRETGRTWVKIGYKRNPKTWDDMAGGWSKAQ